MVKVVIVVADDDDVQGWNQEMGEHMSKFIKFPQTAWSFLKFLWGVLKAYNSQSLINLDSWTLGTKVQLDNRFSRP